jgi:hypothetical protein
VTYLYTEKNHFRFGYDGHHAYHGRTSPEQKFSFEYGRSSQRLTSWREANRLAAKSIRKNFDGPLWILFSGGTDSECVARAFWEADVPFRLATLRMEDGLNAHDLEHAFAFAQEISHPLELFDLNMREFWQSDLLYRYADPIQCVSPILVAHLWLADQVDGIPIIGQGECYLKKDIPADYVPGESPYLPSPWRLIESERLCSLYRHFILNNRPAVPGFFQYLPEQIFTFLNDNPILSDLVQNKTIGKLGTRTSKNQMVRHFYPEINERQKFTGFENISELHDKLRAHLAARFPHSDDDAAILFEDVLKMTSPE